MRDHVVVRMVNRVPLELVDVLAPIGTATVHEAIGRRGYLGPDLVARQDGMRIAGTAVTVLSHPGDNIMMHAAVEVCQPGDVLVVAITAPSTHGMFGDLLATSLMARGVRGLVIDAGVRDISDLREMRFPVWSRHISCQGTVKSTPGSVNVPVVVGEQIIVPGAVICADDDGVVVVDHDIAEQAVERSRERLAKEAQIRARLEDGELGVDLYAMRSKLAEMGVTYIDGWPGQQRADS